MPNVIVVGAQWGDEGKGKVVDYLTEQAQLVVRFQGGNNAGHTVIVDGKKTALRIIPSGILRANTRCLLAPGVVLDPEVFCSEVAGLEQAGIEITPERLGIAGEIALIMPYHRAIDLAEEALRKKTGRQIGTTGKGVGPAYQDSVSRNGIRVLDLVDQERLKSLVEANVEIKNKYLKEVLESDTQFNASEVYDALCRFSERIVPLVTGVSAEIARARKDDHLVIFEGAQGSLLDIHHGTYPYVTSSSLVAGYACASAGVSPRSIDYILGLGKAYATRVGEGPFPSEDEGADGDTLREVGKEFGTVTGRPRRCGWFDAVAMKKAIRINGITSLMITKLDVLTGFPKIKIATNYLLNGTAVDDLPLRASDFSDLEVYYEEVDGWTEDITGVRALEDLPETAKKFLKRIEDLCEVPTAGFSVGPDRAQTIITCDTLKSFASL